MILGFDSWILQFGQQTACGLPLLRSSRHGYSIRAFTMINNSCASQCRRMPYCLQVPRLDAIRIELSGKSCLEWGILREVNDSLRFICRFYWSADEHYLERKGQSKWLWIWLMSNLFLVCIVWWQECCAHKKNRHRCQLYRKSKNFLDLTKDVCLKRKIRQFQLALGAW